MAEDYVIRVVDSPGEVDSVAWDALLECQTNASPFLRHAYLAALHESGSATLQTGWSAHFLTLHLQGRLAACCVFYEKSHSYGEYVFDWAWANAYAEHGLPYYPKAVVAVPFTPVPGARLIARTETDRVALIQTLIQWCTANGMSSLHLLFANEADADACASAGLMLRHTVQFHWKNQFPGAGQHPFQDFEAFLASLSQEKRKKIRQERRKVADAGVRFRWSLGANITPQDWDFFYRCYERTYLEHGNAPYLNRDFFARMATTMTNHWLLFVAEREGRPIATSLIAVDARSTGAEVKNHAGNGRKIAYGRYWGALERVDCLHFEACFYQPLQWCIDHGYHRFEGGAQGEHKMARALLPVKTSSAHWLAHPAFSDAVSRFLEREGQGVSNYLEDLSQRNPFRQTR